MNNRERLLRQVELCCADILNHLKDTDSELVECAEGVMVALSYIIYVSLTKSRMSKADYEDILAMLESRYDKYNNDNLDMEE